MTHQRRFHELLSSVSPITVTGEDVAIEDVTCAPSEAVSGFAFVAATFPWLEPEGAVETAVRRGAAALVLGPGMDVHSRIPTAIVADCNKAYSALCAEFFSHAHRALSIFGVTGTKGKTTVCHLLDAVLRAAGFKTGLLSTIERRIGDWREPSYGTTPDTRILHSLLSEMRKKDATHAILEVSSIGIAEERIHTLNFEGVGFTNLGHDHLTYHGGIENYKHSKARLFTEFRSSRGEPPIAVINIDDAFGRELIELAAGNFITYGLRQGDIQPSEIEFSKEGIRGRLLGLPFYSSLLGKHNMYNLLCATGLALAAGISPKSIVEGITMTGGIPGRLEHVKAGEVSVYIDYAHTSESVSSVLQTLQEINRGQDLVAVLGCSGGSDRSKRTEIAEAALNGADICIFTSDNPRWEEPLAILREMISGIKNKSGWKARRLEITADRKQGIHRGFEVARSTGGVLAVMGKGHECFQEIRGQKIPFDDKQVVLEIARG
jgi:UDP-N-acetylmuramoyl-L-alanyl-D-glutamate--2,6-diaminopimelate ligase